jgi:hypothetical protein
MDPFADGSGILSEGGMATTGTSCLWEQLAEEEKRKYEDEINE